MLSSRAQWLPNLGALSQFSRPVVVELFGHGRSPTPDDPAVLTPASYVEHFKRIRERLGVERWLVCGQSLGASLTIRYAIERPERVIAHAFTNSNSALARPRTLRAGGSCGRLEALAARGRALIDEHPMNPARNRRLPPAVREAFEQDMQLMTVEGYIALLRHTIPEAPMGHRLGENSVPALLVVGERERRFAALREHAERTMPLLEVVGLEGGHAVNIDAAEGFNGALREFFERHAGG